MNKRAMAKMRQQVDLVAGATKALLDMMSQVGKGSMVKKNILKEATMNGVIPLSGVQIENIMNGRAQRVKVEVDTNGKAMCVQGLTGENFKRRGFLQVKRCGKKLNYSRLGCVKNHIKKMHPELQTEEGEDTKSFWVKYSPGFLENEVGLSVEEVTHQAWANINGLVGKEKSDENIIEVMRCQNCSFEGKGEEYFEHITGTIHYSEEEEKGVKVTEKEKEKEKEKDLSIDGEDKTIVNFVGGRWQKEEKGGLVFIREVIEELLENVGGGKSMIDEEVNAEDEEEAENPAKRRKIDDNENENDNDDEDEDEEEEKEENFTCKQCGIDLYFEEVLRKHIDQRHPEESVKHTCGTCDQVFGRRSNLTMHVRTLHGEMEEHTCGTCDQVFGRRSNLARHVKTQHGEREEHSCVECDKVFISRSDLIRHQARLHNGRRWICKQCSKALRSPQSLDLHIQTFHGGKSQTKYKCGKCGHAFRWESSLRRHMISDHKTAEDVSTFVGGDVLLRHIEDHHLGLVFREPTIADGNCWYDAVADQIILLDLPNLPRDHVSVRAMVEREIHKLPQVKQWVENLFEGNNQLFNSFVERHSLNQVWTDDYGIFCQVTNYNDDDNDFFGQC